MKKRLLSIVMALAVIASISAPAFAVDSNYRTFEDVPKTYWAYQEIDDAYWIGVVEGTYGEAESSVRRYSPELTLTLAQFVVIMCRGFYGGEIYVANALADDDGLWYAPAESVAVKHGMLDGLGTYSMTGPATRYQMAQIIYNILTDYDYTLPSDAEIQQTVSKIGDWSQIPAQYQEAVSAVYSMGIITGTDSKGTFSGASSVKRSVAAVVYARVYDAILGAGLTIETVTRFGDTITLIKRRGNQNIAAGPSAGWEAPVIPAGTYDTVADVMATQPVTTQVAMLRYGLKSVTKAASVNDAIDAHKSDDYPTVGTTEDVNLNGYHTNCTLDLSGCVLDYDALELFNKYRNGLYTPRGDAAWAISDMDEEFAMVYAKYHPKDYEGVFWVTADSVEEAMQKLCKDDKLPVGADNKYFCMAHYTGNGKTYYAYAQSEFAYSPCGILEHDKTNYKLD